MKKIVAYIYWMFKSNKNSVPYYRTFVLIILSLMLHAAQAGLLFNIPSGYIFPWSTDEPRSIQWLKAFICLVIVMTILMLIFRQNELDKVIVKDKEIRKMKRFIPVYLAVSIAFTILLAIYHGKTTSR